MELTDIVHTQYALPMGIVVLCLLLLYAFGIKRAEEPAFDKLSADDRKTAGKRRKLKDKKSQANGHVSAESSSEKAVEKKSKLTVEANNTKDTPGKPSNKSVKKEKKENKVEELKNKKNEKNLRKVKQIEEKPVDFDDGKWVEAVSRKEKKNRKKEEPSVEEVKDIISDKQGSASDDGSPAKKKKQKQKKDNNAVPVKIIPDEDTKEKKAEVIEAKEEKQEQEDVKEEKKKKKKDANKKLPAAEEGSETGAKDKKEEENSLQQQQQLMTIPMKGQAETKDEDDSKADGPTKTKKKNKKKGSSSPDAPVENEAAPEKDTVKEQIKKVEVKIEPPPKIVELPVSPSKPMEIVEDSSNVVFDELGDTWKEARLPKKSKKKTRKE